MKNNPSYRSNYCEEDNNDGSTRDNISKNQVLSPVDSQDRNSNEDKLTKAESSNELPNLSKQTSKGIIYNNDSQASMEIDKQDNKMSQKLNDP